MAYTILFLQLLERSREGLIISTMQEKSLKESLNRIAIHKVARHFGQLLGYNFCLRQSRIQSKIARMVLDMHRRTAWPSSI